MVGYHKGDKAEFQWYDAAKEVGIRELADKSIVILPLTDIIGFLGELGYAVITKDDATSAANALFDQERDLRAKGLTLSADEKHEAWRRVCVASLPQKPLTKGKGG